MAVVPVAGVALLFGATMQHLLDFKIALKLFRLKPTLLSTAPRPEGQGNFIFLIGTTLRSLQQIYLFNSHDLQVVVAKNIDGFSQSKEACTKQKRQ